jgi:hypothetical protein
MSESDFIPYGPEGGYGGVLFRLEPPDVNYRVKRITISSGDVLYSIKVEWEHEKNTRESQCGGIGGSETTFELADDEKIQEVKVWYESYVNSVTIITNNQTYNIGGGNRGRFSNFVVPVGEEFLGFIGRSGDFIDALGIITTIVDETHTHKKVTPFDKIRLKSFRSVALDKILNS